MLIYIDTSPHNKKVIQVQKLFSNSYNAPWAIAELLETAFLMKSGVEINREIQKYEF